MRVVKEAEIGLHCKLRSLADLGNDRGDGPRCE